MGPTLVDDRPVTIRLPHRPRRIVSLVPSDGLRANEGLARVAALFGSG